MVVPPALESADAGVDVLTMLLRGILPRALWRQPMYCTLVIKIIAGALQDRSAEQSKDGEEWRRAVWNRYGLPNSWLWLVAYGVIRARFTTRHTNRNAILSSADVMRHNADFTGEKYRDIARYGRKWKRMSPGRGRVMPLLKERVCSNDKFCILPHLRQVAYASSDIPHWREGTG